MDKLLSGLNDRQREAVTAPMGPVLVLAGAGSGKTRVLTYRIAHLIEQGLVSPENILALTFTNKAAGEMKQRIHRMLADGSGSRYGSKLEGEGYQTPRPETIPASKPYSLLPITMGTFHSVCVRILRQDIEKLGLGYGRNFVIFDEDDRGRLLKQITLELGLEERYKYQVFGYYISQAKNRLVTPLFNSPPHEGGMGGVVDNPDLMEALTAVYEEYTERMRSQNAVDFDDLLMLVCKLFSPSPHPSHQGRGNSTVDSSSLMGRGNKKKNSSPSDGGGEEGVLKKYQNKFKYILVDEYQDTNHAQYFMLKKLVGKEKNIFVVGDDAQSIYGFRGANMQNILDFKKDYPKARVIMLEQNYRSTQNILDTAHEVIKLNPFQYEKKLWTANRGGEKVNLYEAVDEVDEAEFVLDQIVGLQKSEVRSQSSDSRESELVYTPILDSFEEKLKRGFRSLRSEFRLPSSDIRGLGLSQSVVLYRTHAQSRALEEVLISSGVPYQIVGGIKFYERREIKDALAFMRLLLNSKDLVSLSRVINLPPRGIGPRTFVEIKKALKKYKYNFDRLLGNIDGLDLSPKALAGAREFFKMFDSPPHEEGSGEVIENKAGRKPNPTMTPSSSPSRGGGPSILDIMHLLLTRSGYKESLLKDGEEGQQRWENVEQLFNVAGKYKDEEWQPALAHFLEEAALMTDLDSMEEGGNKLTLMTLHSAKGLEYDRVFFVGLEEGLLPHARSMMNPDEISEEIRLAYVGITRARKQLYLSYARQRQVYGEIKNSVPSRILKAIPEKLLRIIEL